MTQRHFADLFDKAYLRWLIVRLGIGLFLSILLGSATLCWLLYEPFQGDYAALFKGLSQVHEEVHVAVILTGLVQGVALGLAIFVCLLFWTHRVAGPIFRLKHSFRQLEKGNFMLQVRLREKDQLQDLARILDKGIRSLRHSWHELIDGINDFQKELHQLDANNFAAQSQKLATRLEKIRKMTSQIHG